MDKKKYDDLIDSLVEAESRGLSPSQALILCTLVLVAIIAAIGQDVCKSIEHGN